MGVLGCSMARRKSRASIELGVQEKIFSSTLVDSKVNRIRIIPGGEGFETCCHESIRRKFESNLPLKTVKNKDLRVNSGDPRIDSSRGACGANDSAYGNNGPLGVTVNDLDGSSGKYNRWSSGASTGPVEIGYNNRSGSKDLK
ncbi:hypothetical protein PIB30_021886 [Stylosanthes scabra]|uniref:Uncharacterized protein n=1 Tax=Stylosanthes scabra TaxID=79078 RepID=A0ABU6S912_9FABA|nr:hypothetical protein [Stylosanthes scabra]